MKLTRRNPPHRQWGYADFFDSRRKHQILDLAEAKPDHVVYDLGCGDASFLIYAAEEFGIQNLVGFENMPQRAALARRKVKEHKLQHRIRIADDMYDAELHKADVILDMMVEAEDDFDKLYSNDVKKGAKLVKHDLPLLGFLPDKVQLPFYRMTFPLTKATSEDHWASAALGRKNASIDELWHELYYYSYEKTYDLRDIKRMKRILSRRLE